MPDPLQLTDFHSHLVPSVDDGARSVEDALEGMGRMKAAGITRITTTPHIDASLTASPSVLAERLAAVDEAFGRLEASAREAFPDVELNRGHEVMLDVPDPDLSDARLHLADTHFVLIEWPRLTVPPGTVEALRRLVAQGVRPIIAHPERYRGMPERIRLAEVWRNEGAILQVNYGSLVGRYGSQVRGLAFRLLERGWVDCLSTDFHARPHLELHVGPAEDVLVARGAEEQFALLAATNPRRVLDGKDPLPVPSLPPDRRLWSKLRGLLGTE